MKLLRVILSDTHLGTGRRRGTFNPMEDFHEDDRLAELMDYYSTGPYEDYEVELILNGDIFDLMKVEINGTWPTEITESLAVEKLRLCLEGHPRVVSAWRRFVERRGKRITYIPGNHDPELYLPAVQRLFISYVDPQETGKVHFVATSEAYSLPEGIQIRHGHQFEAIHRFNLKKPMVPSRSGEPILELPWGSRWCMEVLYPAKRHRFHIDRMMPFRRFLLSSLLFDFRFTLWFWVRTSVHFLRYRMQTVRGFWARLLATPGVLKEEILAIADLDKAAIRTLRRLRGVHTLIVGHSHAPCVRTVDGGKLYINTGSWVRMINLDLNHLGREDGLTYALIEYDVDGEPQTSLLRWQGVHREYEPVLLLP